jgi:hypothetical protein
MNILDEKVQHEQKIRILEEKDRQRDNKDKQKDELILQMSNQINQLQEQMKQIIISNSTINNTSNTTNNINNINQTNNTTINFYNYDKPKTDTLKLNPNDLMTENVTKKLIELIFFNKLIPENHVLWRPNMREYRLLVYKDDNWKNITGDSLETIFCNVKNAAYITGHEKINGGDLFHTEEEFFKLLPVVQHAIQKFNGGDPVTDMAIMEIITENREVIKSTLSGNNII